MTRGSTAKTMAHVVLCVLIAYGAGASAVAEHTLPEYSRGYDPARDPFADGRDALALARQTQRRVLIALGGEWCQWCKALGNFLTGNARVRSQLDRHFVVLKVNVSEENDNAEFLAGLPPNMGFPHVYVTADDGRVLHSQDTAQFLSDGRYDEARILAFIERWRAQTGAEQ